MSDPGWLLISVCFLAGFVLLMKGADWLVGGSSAIARRRGLSTLVVGLTIVAFGTSAPEIVVSALAAVEGKVDLSLGNVLGSNVANVGLVLGASALVLPRVLESRLQSREIFWLFASLGIFWWICADREISRVEAGSLFAVFVIYNIHVLRTGRIEVAPEAPEDEYRHPALKTLLGIVAIVGGAKLVVMGAEAGALRFGIPQSVIGLTVVAVGTSLPELAAGLGGAFKGESDISLGNVVGSNVFNLLAVIGIVGLIQPFDAANGGREDPAGLEEAFVRALAEDCPIVLAFSLALVILPRMGGARGGRAKGAFLLLGYVAYSVWLFVARTG